jgi:hypothetical protein
MQAANTRSTLKWTSNSPVDASEARLVISKAITASLGGQILQRERLPSVKVSEAFRKLSLAQELLLLYCNHCSMNDRYCVMEDLASGH